MASRSTLRRVRAQSLSPNDDKDAPNEMPRMEDGVGCTCEDRRAVKYSMAQWMGVLKIA